MSMTAVEISTVPVLHSFAQVRQQTLDLCDPLTPEDMMVQSCAEASPAKWHLAHTTWFYETFILRDFLPGYKVFHPDFVWLFNSYYNALSDQPEKKLRASFSRPDFASILAYRRHVEAGIEALAQSGIPQEAQQRLVLGIHHEQQHQELLCYDIKHAFWTNPLHPVYTDASADLFSGRGAALRWIAHGGGLVEIGHAGEDFSYDNERPRHLEYVEPFSLASRLVTCEEYLAFMMDGGYQQASLWLSEGWEMVKREGWHAPLYWRDVDGGWVVYTLRGAFPLDALSSTPVCHVSYLEADAYARWAGKRLPGEGEWEAAASTLPVAGTFLEGGLLHPPAAGGEHALEQMFGDLWQWTRSPYVGYPGYKPLAGALGEYNGKFMCNQMVLRGGSAVTPRSHIRSTYRNFFAPASRWQFAGIRLASDQRE